jgi:hypothetical protein
MAVPAQQRGVSIAHAAPAPALPEKETCKQNKELEGTCITLKWAGSCTTMQAPVLRPHMHHHAGTCKHAAGRSLLLATLLAALLLLLLGGGGRRGRGLRGLLLGALLGSLLLAHGL